MIPRSTGRAFKDVRVHRHKHRISRAGIAFLGMLAVSLSATSAKVEAKSPVAVPFKDYKLSCTRFQQWTECRAHKLYHCVILQDCKTQCRGSSRRC